jgi:hypothetical protein
MIFNPSLIGEGFFIYGGGKSEIKFLENFLKSDGLLLYLYFT